MRCGWKERAYCLQYSYRKTAVKEVLGRYPVAWDIYLLLVISLSVDRNFASISFAVELLYRTNRPAGRSTMLLALRRSSLVESAQQSRSPV